MFEREGKDVGSALDKTTIRHDTDMLHARDVESAPDTSSPSSLKTAVYEYFKQGLNVVPFRVKEKRPLVEWQKWQTQRQTSEEFDALPWQDADGFALVCGTKLNNGLFLGVLDFDVKNLPEETIQKGKELLKKFLTTQTEETLSKGQHLIYFCREKPKTVSAYHNECALEIIGENKLVIMAPSQGYRRLNDNMPSEINDLNELFETATGHITVKKQFWFDREDLEKKPYKGRNPSCIQTLLKGASEGLRNEIAIRLASYFMNFRGFQPQTVAKILKDWNKLNTPNLETSEIESVIKSAAQGAYIFGCNDPILSNTCSREECPIATKTVVLTENQIKNAEEILEKKDLLNVLLAYGRKRLIGEDNVLLINFVEICSGQTVYPISGIISGYSGSGKNESIRAIKPLMPEEWLFEFTTSTPEAVKYIPEEFAGTLVIYEASSMQSKTGTLGLRAIGESESIETIYPMRDEETGKMMLGRAKTNAKNFVTTESAIDIEPDLYRRVLKTSMNPSYVLTKRVCAKELRESHLPDSLRKLFHKEKEPNVSTEDFKNALRVQDWKAEVVFFAPKELLDLIDVAITKEQQVALRTQFKKILSFIKVLALLNQKNRVIVKIAEKKYVVADPEDYKLGLAILSATILETVSRIEKRQRDVLEMFEKKERLDKDDVVKELRVSAVTAARALKTLAKSGYLKEIMSMKPYIYEQIQDKPNSLVILQNTSQYYLFYEKELKTFLDDTLSLVTSGVLEKDKVKIENPKTNWDTSDKTSDKMPSEPISKVSEQSEVKQLVFSEMTSENKRKEVEKE